MEAIRIQVLDHDARMARLLVDEIGVEATHVIRDSEGTAAPEIEQLDVALLSAEHPKAFAQCRRLKKSAALTEVPVVLYTFSEDDALLAKLAKHETLPSRANAYLLPPIDAARLGGLLEQLLGARGGLRDTTEIPAQTQLEPPEFLPEPPDFPPEPPDLPPEPPELPPEPPDLPPEPPDLPSESPDLLPEPLDLPSESPELLPEPLDLPPEPPALSPESSELPLEAPAPPAPPLPADELAREREELVEVLQGLLPEGEDSGPVDLVLRIGEEVERLRALAGEGTSVAAQGQELAELREELVRMSPALDEAQRQIEALTKERDVTRQQLDVLAAERDVAVRERTDLLTEREVLRAERVELREARDAAVRRCQDLRDEHKAAALETQGRREAEQARLSDAQIRLVELQAQYAEAREQLTVMREQLTTAQERLTSTQERLTTAERGLASSLERGVKLDRDLEQARKVALEAEEESADQRSLFERLEDGYRAEIDERDATIRGMQELDARAGDRLAQLEQMLVRVRELAPNLATLAALAAALEPIEEQAVVPAPIATPAIPKAEADADPDVDF